MRWACLAGLLAGVWLASPALAFEGDYIWEDRFKASLAKINAGYPKDQYELGEMYLRGRGTRKDPAQALHWFEKAAQQGHTRAAYKAGWLYLHNDLFSRSSEKALPLLRQAAEAGFAPAQYELGQAYASGIGGNWDNTEALNWLAKAKQAEYPPAEAGFDRLVARMVSANKLKQAQQRQEAVAPPITVASAKQPPTSESAVETLNIILHSQWDGENGPSRVLPSELTDCQRQNNGIECVSRRLTRQVENSRMIYQVRAHISDVARDGHFQIAYSDKVIDSSQSSSTLSTTAQMMAGDVPANSLDCILGTKRVIHCLGKSDRQYRFTGQ